MKATQDNASLIGLMGMAWKVDIPEVAKKFPEGAPADLTVCAFYVNAAYAHPVWPNYYIGCVKLKHVDGFPDAVIHLEGATHEIFVIALDPDVEMEIDGAPAMLTPINFAGQFIATNEEAYSRTEQAVRDVIDGRLSPDTDFMSQWIARFSDSNVRK
jgi:hypothetical protein